jgi:hypothetical protein
MADELSIDDAKALLALCASGRLYAIEEWVQAGRSLEVPRTLRKTPLQIAFAAGFHSLIDYRFSSPPSVPTDGAWSSRRHALADWD